MIEAHFSVSAAQIELERTHFFLAVVRWAETRETKPRLFVPTFVIFWNEFWKEDQKKPLKLLDGEEENNRNNNANGKRDFSAFGDRKDDRIGQTRSFADLSYFWLQRSENIFRKKHDRFRSILNFDIALSSADARRTKFVFISIKLDFIQLTKVNSCWIFWSAKARPELVLRQIASQVW